MNPGKFSQMMKYLTRAKKANPDLPDVTFADKITQPPVRQDVETMDAINAFIRRERQQKAGGGTIAGGNIQGQQIGDRTGFAKPVFLPSKNEYVVKGRDSNVVKRFKVDDYKNKQEAKKETFKFYKDFTEKNREKAKITSIENRAKFNKARTDYKISINKWVQNWMNNNVDNYTLRQSDKFIKDLKKDFKKNFDIDSPAKNVKSTIVNDYPNIGTSAKTGKAAFKPYGIVPIPRTGALSKAKAEAPYESLFKRAFFTKKINDNSVLKNRISKYLDYYTLKKPGGSMALDRIKAQYADTLNNLDDVMYVLSDDTGLINVAKNNLFKNIFPQYSDFRKKQNASKISRDANIAKIEKTIGPKKLKQILNGGTSIDKFLVNEGKALKKIFDVEGLDKSLRYSIDHNLGISNIAKMSKLDMEMALQSLIGTTVKRNNELGWGGYTAKSQKLIRNINEGKNVASNLDELNKITQDAYGPELKGKNAYTIVNDKLKFTEDFTFRSNPEERFKSYFREIYKTPEGKKQIIKQAGSLKNIEKKANILSAFCSGRRKLNSGSGSLSCSMEEIQTNMKKQINEAAKVSKDGKIPKRFGKLRAVGSAFFGDVAIPLEYMFMAPDLVAGDIDGALRSSTAGLFGAGKVDLEKLPPGEGKKYIRHTNAITNFLNNYQSKLVAEDQLKNLKPGDEEQFVVSDQLAQAEKNMADIVKDYQGFGYTYQPGEKGLLEGKVAAQKLIRDKVTSDFDKKIDKGASTEFFKDSNKDLLKENLKSLGGDPFTVTPINNLEDYIKNKGEATAGNTNILFNRLPYTLEQAEAYGVPDIFNTYAGGYAGVETPGSMEKGQEIDMGIKDVRDAYSSLPINMASQLAALEKKELEEGMLKRRLEDQLFAGGGIAKLAGVSSGVAPVRGPNSQGLLSLKNRVRNY